MTEAPQALLDCPTLLPPSLLLLLLLQVKVPIGGLTPYPKDDSSSVKTSNVDVTLSPQSLMTLVDVNASVAVSAAYKAAFEAAGTDFDGNAMVAGAR
jgi:hypothetical protein